MQGRSIQKSDSSRGEAVLESVGTCPQTFSRWKKVEERMSGVSGVLNHAGCFSEAAGSVDRVNRWETDLHDSDLVGETLDFDQLNLSLINRVSSELN